MTYLSGPEAGRKLKTLARLDGDTLQIAYVNGGADWPAGFDGPLVTVLTVRREKR
jgi:hypothetical protein